MSTLPGGWRLQAVQIRNWGTFDGNAFHTAEFGCDSVCITGANGSGKSTVVDAMLTLLVPPDYRNYNVAASEKGAKRERSMLSYVKGAYDKEESAESNKGQTKFLREKPGPISILLAVFRNPLLESSVTLAQLHWHTDGNTHHAIYLVREGEFRIPELKIGAMGTAALKLHFAQQGWSCSDEFGTYQGVFCNLLRIPSPAALRLFCRTVSVKEIGSITEFVRALMLKPHATKAYLDGIEKHFADLEHIHAQLQQTKQEMAWLEPVEKAYNDYRIGLDESDRLTTVRQATEVIMYRDAGGLLDAEIEANERHLVDKQNVLVEHQNDEAKIDERIAGIRISLKANDTFAAVEKLRQAEDAYSAELTAARPLRANLDGWLTALNYGSTIGNDKEFVRLQGWANETIESQTHQRDKLMMESGRAEATREALDAEALKIGKEVGELEKKRTKISGDHRAMRDEICRALGLNEGILPFIGELIDVKPSENEWRKTIEILLHGRALSVVVPEDLYHRVAGYVDGSDFKHRFTYLRAHKGSGAEFSSDSGKVSGKLDIRPDAWCRGWLQAMLFSDYSHRCCATIEEFNRCNDRAITRNLHVKGGERAFKETARGYTDYDILGWANEGKRQALKAKLQELRTQISQKSKDVEDLKKQSKAIGNGVIFAQKITAITSFRHIDTTSIENDLTTASTRRRELEESDEKLRELNSSLKEAQQEKETVRGLANVVSGEIGSLRTIGDQLKKRRVDVGSKFNTAAREFDWRQHETAVAQFYIHGRLRVDTLSEDISAVFREIDRAKSIAAKAAYEAELLLGPAMRTFLDGTRDRGYSSDWTSTASSAPAMIDHLIKLRNEKFYAQEAEFSRQMEGIIGNDLSVGRGELNGQQSDNKRQIATLNITLGRVDYNEGTFVRLSSRPSRDINVATFKDKLDACIAHSIGMTPEQRYEHFKAVKALITHIREHRVESERGANPNNWDDYYLEEIDRVSGDRKSYHSDSDSRSGGQKAKLACTIVAAAMAYQMAHTGNPHAPTFRLVLIDEIFSKTDDENSSYALAVFAKFDFQLVFVSPRDGRLKLVIPHVGSFHLAQNPTGRDSQLVSMTRADAIKVAEKEDASADT